MQVSYPLETVRTDIGGITGSSLPAWEGARFFKIPLMANESQTIQQNDFETTTVLTELGKQYLLSMP